jgi:hypothetical protein
MIYNLSSVATVQRSEEARHGCSEDGRFRPYRQVGGDQG